MNPRACFTGNYPVLSRIKETYGEETATSWLNIQINDLSEYAGVKKLDIRQNEELASTILAFYGYMTVAELMLFFFKFKAGEYGKFYGSVDPLVISEALLDFKAERAKVYADIEKERINKESKKYHNVPNKVTYEEYLKLKQQADNGDKHAIEKLKK